MVDNAGVVQKSYTYAVYGKSAATGSWRTSSTSHASRRDATGLSISAPATWTRRRARSSDEIRVGNATVTHATTGPVAVLRGYHGDQDPNIVTLALRISPTRTQRAGSYSSLPGDIPLNSGWFLESNSEQLSSDDASSHLEWICTQIQTKLTIIEALEARGWEFSLVLRWPDRGYEGPYFSVDAMARLAAVAIPVRIVLVDP